MKPDQELAILNQIIKDLGLRNYIDDFQMHKGQELVRTAYFSFINTPAVSVESKEIANENIELRLTITKRIAITLDRISNKLVDIAEILEKISILGDLDIDEHIRQN